MDFKLVYKWNFIDYIMSRLEEKSMNQFSSLSEPKLYVKDSRELFELSDESIELMITSPPYWQIKDYGNKKQIGWNQDLTKYFNDLNSVWLETYRALKKGGRMCINIGDQYIRGSKTNPYQIIPLHAMLVNNLLNGMELDSNNIIYLGSIIWQKVSTTKTSGGGVFMGSYPYPRNGMVTYNYEYIAIFKKLGKDKSLKPTHEAKIVSKMSKAEWSEYFTGTWNFPGVSQKNHIAMFPEELPYRLIRMFSFPGETILDPFAGSGTTLKVASELGRNSIGYEIGWDTKTEESWEEVIKQKVPNIEFNY